MASKCLFESRGDYRCSESCTNLIKLSTIPECEIIINRCCLPLDLSPYQLEQLWICQKHRDAMTKDWRPRLTCQYPLHSGTKKKLSTRNVITAELSKQIDTMYGERVPTGSRKYDHKRNLALNPKYSDIVVRQWGFGAGDASYEFIK